MSINFPGSFEKKDGFLSLEIKRKLKLDHNISSIKKAKQFMKSVEKMSAEFDFYSDQVKKSKKLPDHRFTNFLHEKTDQKIKTGVYEVFSDPSIADSLKGDYVRFNDKILECIKLYYPQVTRDSEIFKSNLQDSAGVSKPVRVFSIVNIDTSIPKATFKIVLIDPFHLVIPSELRNGKETIPKHQVESEVYRKNSNNDLCMSDYVNSIY